MSRMWTMLVVSVSLVVTLWVNSVKATPVVLSGETTFGAIGWVDWLVLFPDDYSGTDYEGLVGALVSSTELDLYAYLYQIESNQTNTDQLTVRPLGEWSEIGALNLDLDNWHDLSGEHEATPQQSLVKPWYIDPSPAAPSWNFASPPTGYGLVGSGQESWLLYILSPMPPTFNIATLTNSGSATAPLPVPSPEPMTSLLLLAGIVGVAMYRRRSF